MMNLKKIFQRNVWRERSGCAACDVEHPSQLFRQRKIRRQFIPCRHLHGLRREHAASGPIGECPFREEKVRPEYEVERK